MYLRKALLVPLMMAVVGCGGLKAQPVPAGEPAVSPETRVSGLEAMESPKELSLAQFTQGLREFVASGSGPVAPRLAALYEHWQLKPLGTGSVLMLEADLDGNGQTEVATVFKDPKSVNGLGTLFVIYQQGGKYAVDRVTEDFVGATLYLAGDLNQDGKPELVWASTSVGANTATSSVFVTAWAPGSFVRLPGDIVMTNMRLEADGSDLVLHGNLKGGYGAGVAQRERTDRYRWQDGSLKLSDRRYAPSAYAYHRLQDGLLYEEQGNSPAASQAYADAAAPDRAILPDGDAVAPEWREKLSQAVQVFAHFRIGLISSDAHLAAGPYGGLLTAVRGAASHDDACQAATAWAEANPDFIKALNSPRGYANPQWKPNTLCGPLPNF
jgi:hypothetical protein